MIKTIPHTLGEGIAGHSIEVEPQKVDHEATRALKLEAKEINKLLAQRAEYRKRTRKVSMGLY